MSSSGMYVFPRRRVVFCESCDFEGTADGLVDFQQPTSMQTFWTECPACGREIEEAWE